MEGEEVCNLSPFVSHMPWAQMRGIELLSVIERRRDDHRLPVEHVSVCPGHVAVRLRLHEGSPHHGSVTVLFDLIPPALREELAKDDNRYYPTRTDLIDFAHFSSLGLSNVPALPGMLVIHHLPDPTAKDFPGPRGAKLSTKKGDISSNDIEDRASDCHGSYVDDKPVRVWAPLAETFLGPWELPTQQKPSSSTRFLCVEYDCNVTIWEFLRNVNDFNLSSTSATAAESRPCWQLLNTFNFAEVAPPPAPLLSSIKGPVPSKYPPPTHWSLVSHLCVSGEMLHWVEEVPEVPIEANDSGDEDSDIKSGNKSRGTNNSVSVEASEDEPSIKNDDIDREGDAIDSGDKHSGEKSSDESPITANAVFSGHVGDSTSIEDAGIDAEDSGNYASAKNIDAETGEKSPRINNSGSSGAVEGDESTEGDSIDAEDTDSDDEKSRSKLDDAVSAEENNIRIPTRTFLLRSRALTFESKSSAIGTAEEGEGQVDRSIGKEGEEIATQTKVVRVGIRHTVLAATKMRVLEIFTGDGLFYKGMKRPHINTVGTFILTAGFPYPPADPSMHRLDHRQREPLHVVFAGVRSAIRFMRVLPWSIDTSSRKNDERYRRAPSCATSSSALHAWRLLTKKAKRILEPEAVRLLFTFYDLARQILVLEMSVSSQNISVYLFVVGMSPSRQASGKCPLEYRPVSEIDVLGWEDDSSKRGENYERFECLDFRAFRHHAILITQRTYRCFGEETQWETTCWCEVFMLKSGDCVARSRLENTGFPLLPPVEDSIEYNIRFKAINRLPYIWLSSGTRGSLCTGVVSPGCSFLLMSLCSAEQQRKMHVTSKIVDQRNSSEKRKGLDIISRKGENRNDASPKKTFSGSLSAIENEEEIDSSTKKGVHLKASDAFGITSKNPDASVSKRALRATLASHQRVILPPPAKGAFRSALREQRRVYWKLDRRKRKPSRQKREKEEALAVSNDNGDDGFRQNLLMSMVPYLDRLSQKVLTRRKSDGGDGVLRGASQEDGYRDFDASFLLLCRANMSQPLQSDRQNTEDTSNNEAEREKKKNEKESSVDHFEVMCRLLYFERPDLLPLFVVVAEATVGRRAASVRRYSNIRTSSLAVAAAGPLSSEGGQSAPISVQEFDASGSEAGTAVLVSFASRAFSCLPPPPPQRHNRGEGAVSGMNAQDISAAKDLDEMEVPKDEGRNNARLNVGRLQARIELLCFLGEFSAAVEAGLWSQNWAICINLLSFLSGNPKTKEGELFWRLFISHGYLRSIESISPSISNLSSSRPAAAVSSPSFVSSLLSAPSNKSTIAATEMLMPAARHVFETMLRFVLMYNLDQETIRVDQLLSLRPSSISLESTLRYIKEERIARVRASDQVKSGEKCRIPQVP